MRPNATRILSRGSLCMMGGFFTSAFWTLQHAIVLCDMKYLSRSSGLYSNCLCYCRRAARAIEMMYVESWNIEGTWLLIPKHDPKHSKISLFSDFHDRKSLKSVWDSDCEKNDLMMSSKVLLLSLLGAQGLTVDWHFAEQSIYLKERPPCSFWDNWQIWLYIRNRWLNMGASGTYQNQMLFGC